MAEIQISVEGLQRVWKASFPVLLLLSVLGCVLQLGRVVERWDRVGNDVADLLDKDNPVLRRADLVLLSNQYTVLAGQVEGYRAEAEETRVWVASLRLDLARLGVKTSPPPWERKRIVITTDDDDEDHDSTSVRAPKKGPNP